MAPWTAATACTVRLTILRNRDPPPHATNLRVESQPRERCVMPDQAAASA